MIGNGYVGGIVGENATNVTLKNCINQGVAAGYKRYVGGIVGYNQADSTIADAQAIFLTMIILFTIGSFINGKRQQALPEELQDITMEQFTFLMKAKQLL